MIRVRHWISIVHVGEILEIDNQQLKIIYTELPGFSLFFFYFFLAGGGGVVKNGVGVLWI